MTVKNHEAELNEWGWGVLKDYPAMVGTDDDGQPAIVFFSVLGQSTVYTNQTLPLKQWKRARAFREPLVRRWTNRHKHGYDLAQGEWEPFTN